MSERDQTRNRFLQSSENGQEQRRGLKPANLIAQEYLSVLPLPVKADGTPVKPLTGAIKHSQNTSQALVIASTVCPPYSSNEDGVPDYQDLQVGISPNTNKHFESLPKANKILESNGIKYIHFFLMADTEVDLTPFLDKLDISPEEFLIKCKQSTDLISERVGQVYGEDVYSKENLPQAVTFLEYFGVEVWFERYQKYLDRLLSECVLEPEGRIARSLEYDYQIRQSLVKKLLGNNVSEQDGIGHIARQKAQYMTFASLMREKFGSRLVIVNHRTPNFAWMNDRIVREPDDPIKLANGSYLSPLPLIELDINTLPKE